MRTREERELRERLSSLDLLAGLPAAELRRLCEAGEQVHLPAGWTFVHEHTPADTCYLVLEGEARVCVGGREVARIHAGDLIGEAALLDGALRNATVTAVTSIELLRLGFPQLARLADRSPVLRAALLERHRTHAQEHEQAVTGQS